MLLPFLHHAPAGFKIWIAITILLVMRIQPGQFYQFNKIMNKDLICLTFFWKIMGPYLFRKARLDSTFD